jgi:Stigma-specific protein, Stig1
MKRMHLRNGPPSLSYALIARSVWRIAVLASFCGCRRTEDEPSQPSEPPVQVAPREPICAPTAISCETDCVTLATNNSHCGSCGHKCSTDERCVDGQCKAMSCEESCNRRATICKSDPTMKPNDCSSAACLIACDVVPTPTGAAPPIKETPLPLFQPIKLLRDAGAQGSSK